MKLIVFLMALVIHTALWYQSNAQLVWNWWKDKALLSSLLFAMPVSLMIWYTTKFGYEAYHSLWAMRFVYFAASILPYSIFTWIHLDENPFKIKTIISLALALLIISIQVFWRE